MPTIEGVVFFLAAAFLFFRTGEGLFGLVIVSAIFEASSIYVGTDHGIQPYYMVGTIYVLQSFARGRWVGFGKLNFYGKRWLILFLFVAVLSAIVLPRVFAGVPVYDPYVGIDDGLLIRPPLHPSLANITQCAYLLLYVLILLSAAASAKAGAFSQKAYRFSFYFLAGIVTLQFICAMVGIHFPYELLQTHGGYSVQTAEVGDLSSRYPGTFTESSEAGLALVTFAAGFMAERIQSGKSLIPLMISLFTLVLVRSTAAFAAFAIVFVLLLVTNKAFRFPYYLNLKIFQRTIFLVLIGAIAVGAAILSPLRSSIEDVTVNKSETSSYVNRLAADAYALQLVGVTKGLGVGMGSNRPSSIFPSLLSTVGIAGLLVFVVMYYQFTRNAEGDRQWLRWACLALIIDMALGLPDYTAPWPWVMLALTVQAGVSQDNVRYFSHI